MDCCMLILAESIMPNPLPFLHAVIEMYSLHFWKQIVVPAFVLGRSSNKTDKLHHSPLLSTLPFSLKLMISNLNLNL